MKHSRCIGLRTPGVYHEIELLLSKEYGSILDVELSFSSQFQHCHVASASCIPIV